MATLNDLKMAISRLLMINSVNRVLKLNSNTPERAFEAYVFALCCVAVRNQGGSAVVTGRNTGPNPATYVFRGAPGSMASKSQDFCYANCILNNASFEIHVDVEYVGSSGASHEIDVSLYDSQRAVQVRASNRYPKTNISLVAAIECKFYMTARPTVALARTFVGLLSDCTTNQLEAYVSNTSTADIDRFLSNKSRPEPFTDLTPLNLASEERFVRFLEQKLRKWSMSK